MKTRKHKTKLPILESNWLFNTESFKVNFRRKRFEFCSSYSGHYGFSITETRSEERAELVLSTRRFKKLHDRCIRIALHLDII